MLFKDLRVVILVHDLKAAARFYGEALEWPQVIRAAPAVDAAQRASLVVRRAEGMEESHRVGHAAGITIRTAEFTPLFVVHKRLEALGFCPPALRGTGLLYVADQEGNRLGITDEPCQPSLQPLDAVTIFVSNLDRARPFYDALFGPAAPVYCMASQTQQSYQAGDVTVLVVEAEVSTQQMVVGRDTGMMVVFSDITQAVYDLAQAGGYLTPPFVGPDGLVAVAMDPDGNRLQLAAAD